MERYLIEQATAHAREHARTSRLTMQETLKTQRLEEQQRRIRKAKEDKIREEEEMERYLIEQEREVRLMEELVLRKEAEAKAEAEAEAQAEAERRKASETAEDQTHKRVVDSDDAFD